jgi:hypothetical protein
MNYDDNEREMNNNPNRIVELVKRRISKKINEKIDEDLYQQLQLKLSHFAILSQLGSGHFGKVVEA